MNCKECEGLFLLYTVNELSPDQRTSVENHLKGCTSCRASLDEYIKAKRQIAALREIPDMTDISVATMAIISVRPSPSRIGWYWGRKKLALIAISLIVILVTLIALSPWNFFPGNDIVMAKASEAVARIQSYQAIFTMTTTMGGQTSSQTSRWDYQSPDHWHEVVNLEDRTYEVITLGDIKYVRNPQGGSFTPVDFISSTPNKWEALQILQSLSDIERLPPEKIDGSLCLHFRGSVDMERRIVTVKNMMNPGDAGYGETIKQLEALREARTNIDVWIDKSDYFIRKVQQSTVSQHGEYFSIKTYSNFNLPVAIEPPVTDSGALLSGWQQINNFSLGPFMQPPLPNGTSPALSEMETYLTIRRKINIPISIPIVIPEGMWLQQAYGQYDSSGPDFMITLLYGNWSFSGYIAFKQTASPESAEYNQEMQENGFQEIEIQGVTGYWRQGRTIFADYKDPSSQYRDMTQIEVRWEVGRKSYSLIGKGISLEQLSTFAGSLTEIK